MKTIKTLIISIILLVSTSINAHAIGKTEKGVLIGVASMLLLPTIFNNADKIFDAQNYNHQRVVTNVIEDPYPQTVVYKTRIIEKVYYEPTRKYNNRHNRWNNRKLHKRFHKQHRRYNH